MIRILCICIGLLPLINSTPELQYQDGEVLETIDVPVQYYEHRHKRDLQSGSYHEMLFYAFGKNFSLYFEEHDHVLMGANTPIIAAFTDRKQSGGVGYKRIPDVMSKLQMKSLRDVRNNAVAVEYVDNDGEQRLMGLIDDSDMRLKWSLYPSNGEVQPTVRVSKLLLDIFNFPNSRDEWAVNPRAPIYRSREPKPTPDLSTRRPIPNVPETVYPEVLVLVDYDAYNAYDKNLVEIAKYQLALWSAIDLRFRSLVHPKIRLNIAGVVIATDRNAAPYSHYVEPDVSELLTPMAIHLHQVAKNLPNYDVAMHLVHRPLHTIKSQGFVGGAAAHRGVCTITGVGTALDGGNFNGISNVAHELGHLFGADDEIKGYEHRKQCLDDNLVFIMGYANDKDKDNKVRMHFSKCSLAAMHKFLSSSDAKCLYNKPNVGKPIPKVLPQLSLGEQCIKDYGPGWDHSNSGDEACQTLVCCKALLCRSVSSPAAEGTACQRGKVCLNGKCVLRPKELSHIKDNFQESKRPDIYEIPNYPPRRPNGAGRWNPRRRPDAHVRQDAPWWADLFDFKFT